MVTYPVNKGKLLFILTIFHCHPTFNNSRYRENAGTMLKYTKKEYHHLIILA